jgi:hypothetical protein
LGGDYTGFDLQNIDSSLKYIERKDFIYSNTAYASKVINLFGDSMNFDFNSYYNKIDLFYIDGAHAYDFVKSDTINAIKCVKNGGIIVWHDYGRYGINGVTKYLHEFSQLQKIYRFPGSCLAYCIVRK